MVIIPLINETNVKRVLVDLGSSADVMYYNLFKKLGFNFEDLVPTDVHLVGFNAASVWPLGKITLSLTVGTVTVPVEFIVVNVPSPYNAILGRAWVHSIQGVASTYHQFLKFIGKNGVEEIRGSQMAS